MTRDNPPIASFKLKIDSIHCGLKVGLLLKMAVSNGYCSLSQEGLLSFS